MDTPDADHEVFGYWLHTQSDGRWYASAFHNFVNGRAAPSDDDTVGPAAIGGGLNGTATYMGGGRCLDDTGCRRRPGHAGPERRVHGRGEPEGQLLRRSGCRCGERRDCVLPGRPGKIAGSREGDAGCGQADGRIGFLRRQDAGRARSRQRKFRKLGRAVPRQRRRRDQRAAKPCHRPVRSPLPRRAHRRRVRRRPAVTAPLAGRNLTAPSSPGRDGARQHHHMRPVARRGVQRRQGQPQDSCRIPTGTEKAGGACRPPSFQVCRRAAHPGSGAVRSSRTGMPGSPGSRDRAGRIPRTPTACLVILLQGYGRRRNARSACRLPSPSGELPGRPRPRRHARSGAVRDAALILIAAPKPASLQLSEQPHLGRTVVRSAILMAEERGVSRCRP